MIICNKCGKKLVVENNILKEDYIFIRKEWGYFSKKDGIVWEIHLCEKCADRLDEDFLNPAKRTIQREML